MRIHARSAATRLLALAAVIALPAVAQAGCVPGVGSDANYNSCVGANSLESNMTGGSNTATGASALHSNTTGSYNSANGQNALGSNTSGNNNTAIGDDALGANTTGSNNIALGDYAGFNLSIGSDNIDIGNWGMTGESSTIRIGTPGTQSRAFIAGISGVTISDGQRVVVDAFGQLGIAPFIPGAGNTGSGFEALHANTIGNYNTATGASALAANTTGDRNTGSGSRALYSNISGNDNTASGSYALYGNTTGDLNTASGMDTLHYNTTGASNTAVGASALYLNSAGSNNIAVGYNAGMWLTNGDNNIDIGNVGKMNEAATIRIGTKGTHRKAFIAGIRGVSLSGGQGVVVNADGQLGVAPAIPGVSNVALGGSALIANTTGGQNTAVGVSTLAFNTTGGKNTATGASALGANTTGSFNTASGASALNANSTGSRNVAVGYEAAKSQTTGSSNTAIGFQAGLSWTSGRNNVALGAGAGKRLTTGSDNISIGSPGEEADTAVIRIGVENTQTAAFIAGIRGVNITGGETVVVNANGQLGVVSSSRRYKQDILPMGDASNALMQLEPVTFRYKAADENGQHPLQYGLIAEDVAKAMPALAIYNDKGQPESVAYQLLPSLLLNEFQKQAHELAAAKAELAETKADVEALKAMVSRLAATQPGVHLASTGN